MPKSRRGSGNCPLSSFSQDSRGLKPVQEDTPQLMRTRSDVGVRRRGNVRTSSDQRRIRRHRFSINGHFYNHKVEGSWRKKPRGHHHFLGSTTSVPCGPWGCIWEARHFQLSVRVVSVMEASLVS